MAKFDPDAYLRETAPASVEAPAFDPDAYLRGATAPPIETLPGPRRTYTAAEVPAAAMRNLPASAKQFATGLYEAVTNPVQTIKTVGDIGAGALRSAVPTSVRDFIDRFDADPASTQRAMDVANAVGGMYKERYGSLEGIKRTLAEDPVGAAGDLSTLLTGGAGATRIAAGAAGRAAPRVAAPLAQAAGALETAATATNPLSAVTVPAQAALEQVRRVAPSPLTAQQQANLPRDMALERARAEGYMAPPGSIDPVSGRFVLAERIAGKTLLEQMMSVRNQETTNKLARRAVGVGEDTPLTSDAMKAVRKEAATQGYEPIKRIGSVATDTQYLNDLAGVEQAFTGQAASFPGAVPNKVQQIVDSHLVQNFDAGDAIKRIQDLRNDASASFRRGEPDIANAQRGIANALENQVERGIQASGASNAAQMLDDFRAARQRMAISYAVENAIREGTNNVSATKLASDLQRGKYMTGDLQNIAEFASRFPRVSQLPSQIGTPSSGAILGLGGTVGAVTGGLMGGAGGAAAGAGAGAAAAAVPNMLSAAMRRYLMTQGAQRAATPRYDPFAERLVSDITARNALLAQQTNEAREERNALMGIR
jgi:hypothetical protein